MNTAQRNTTLSLLILTLIVIAGYAKAESHEPWIVAGKEHIKMHYATGQAVCRLKGVPLRYCDPTVRYHIYFKPLPSEHTRKRLYLGQEIMSQHERDVQDMRLKELGSDGGA